MPIFGTKIKRELNRLKRQIFTVPIELLRKTYFRRRYDSVYAHSIRRIGGEIPFRREVAIYLIYPTNGVLASHLDMLSEIERAGISAFVVSNAPLTEADRMALARKASLIIERPNVGYDFGGYRDAIRELAPRLAALDRLWILNDSVWLVPQSESWFDTARRLDVDFVGASSNSAVARAKLESFREMGWGQTSDHKGFHYSSYALSVGPHILSDSTFLEFWNKLEIRNDKRLTVKYGETGLSQWVLRYGYSHRATCEFGDLDRELLALSSAEVDMVARDLVIADDERLAALKAEILFTDPASESGRVDRIKLILAAVSRNTSVYTIPGYMLVQRSFHFLKKLPLTANADAAATMLRIIKRIEGEMGRHIADEANVLTMRWSELGESSDDS